MASSANSPPEAGAAAAPPGPPRHDGPTAWLYRHRGATAVPLALYAVWAARPTPLSLAAGVLLCAAGEGLRVAALRHAGGHTRGRTLRAPRLVTEGPYAVLRHPLYLGNALASSGLVVASRAGWPLFPLLFAALFLLQYTLFMRREERFLADTFGAAWCAYAARVPALGLPRPGAAAAARRAGEPAPPAPPPLGLGAALRLELSTLRTVLVLLLLVALRPRLTLPG